MLNKNQKSSKQCDDYKVRFLCSEGSISDTRGIVCEEYRETPFMDRETTQVAMVTTRRLIMAGALALVELHHAAGIRCLDRITRRNYKEFGQK